ncbi:uncharacterized protein B0P05DRAFT_555745 [Gilbertella persicaria]|uniref:Phospholipid/glycerol acyltransferase domain-containing protein n=1 Tax=Rhizopus stolonifer TaxID=4846 RepID=A0A367KWD5_RHIST|nr:uncharacterized protein B0P05DRAFT_555745 [Gilbertella persicaria]KAI8063401.1 hypothetical protein B0P05DRAFT_555745 [Gilbertella persicaria]RCI06474.1 hypothetical protein CU098_012695 [Rhizopus stolonifer]
MEKYSRWRDASTGIQPFLPPVPPRTDASLLVTLSNVVHWTVGPLQGSIKLILISLVSVVYVLLNGLSVLLTPLGPLKRAWHTLYSTLLIRLILFLMGFFYIKKETVSIRKSRTHGVSPHVHHGDVIIANWTSYVDILYLAYRFNPVFTQIYTDTNKVRMISLWEAIQLTHTSPASSGHGLYTLEELANKAKQHKWGPVVVFPEGTTTNGRALLKFAPVFTDCHIDASRYHIMAFKYEYGTMSPTFTVGSLLMHLFRLCSQFHNTLIVKQLASFEPLGELSDALTTSLGHLAKLRKTNLALTDKREFLSFYHSKRK